jgi:putative tricarboxylic transport membrane protein
MADRVIFVCIVILAAVYFYATAQIPSLEIGDPLGPKAFPRLLGIALVITGGILLMEMWRARGDKARKDAAAPADWPVLRVLGGVVVWTALYFSVFELLGFVIATSIYLLVLMAYFHPGRWMTNILTSVLFCIGTYVMFNHVLGVNLTKGILPF